MAARESNSTIERRWPRVAATIAGGYALLGGLVTLTGWLTANLRLISWDYSGITMKVNSALCAVFAGAAIMMIALRVGSRSIVTALGALVAMIGTLTMFEHLTGINLGIDNLIVTDTFGGLPNAASGRMGPPGSTSFILIGLAIILLTRGRRPRGIASQLGLFAVGIASLSLVGYWYGASVMYSLPRITGIALQTATMVFSAGLGVVFCTPDSEPMRLLRARSAAGALARRMLPLIIALPAVLGWLRVNGEHLGLYDTKFGTALFALAIIALLTAMFWRSLASADRHEVALSRAQAELVTKEQQLRHITDSAAVIVAQCSRDYRFVFVNRAGADFFGLPVDQIVGRTMADVMGERAIAGIKPYVDRVLQGQRVEFESEIHYRTIGTRFMRIVYTPDFDGAGGVRGWISAVTDLTSRRETETALRTAADALKQADRRKDEFLATLAHELRNPLAPIANSLAIIERSRSNAQMVDAALTIMQRQLSQMVRIIDDLIDISRVTRDTLELRLEQVDLRRVVNDAIDATRPLADSMRHQIVVSMPDDVQILADPARLTQVFGNLLHNACKFSEVGKSIELTVMSEPDTVVITVRDDGIGIDGHHIESVFEMFTQVDRSLSRSRSGLGIGLTLVKRLVELHNGTVIARSDGLGKGSSFVVRLPARVAVASANDGATRPAVIRQGLRILVVDDNRDAATTLADLLEMSGNETHLAHDGVEAVEVAIAKRPQVVLLDIGLPRMNGYDVCREIRKTDWGREALVVAISGWGQAEDRKQSAEAGFDRHIVKPVDYATLMSILAEQTTGVGGST